MTSGLFRAEAIENRKRRLEGDVIITRSLPLSVITWLLTVITITLALWVVLGRYTRTETVPGAIATNGVFAKVYAAKAGQVVWLGVKDGDLVHQGQPIATIRTEQALEGGASPDSERLASVGEQSHLIRQELEYEERRSAKEQERLNHLINDLITEHARLRGAIAFQQQAVESTKASFDAITSVVEKGFETKTVYEQRRQAWLAASTQLQSLEGQILQLDERRSESESSLAELPEEHASKVANLRSALADLKQRHIDVEGTRAYTILAPISGQVTAIQTVIGRTTDGRLPLLAILPSDAIMEATLYAPSRAIGMAKPGQEVRIMYDAFPYQRFGTSTGHIAGISRSVLAADEVDGPFKLQEPVYEVRVRLDRQRIEAFGQAMTLRPGMTLTADIIIDRRSFLDWLLEPVRAVRYRA